MKAQTKKAKIIDYFIANPDAKPKDVAAKFKTALSTVYTLRKQAQIPAGYLPPLVDSTLEVLDQAQANEVYQLSLDLDANAKQYGGTHYVSMGVQPWSAMQAWMTPEAFAGFLRGNAIKYLARTDKKGGLEDVLKARHYIEKLIEVMEANK